MQTIGRADCLLFVYDCTSEDSFSYIEEQLTQVSHYALSDLEMLLVSTKCDLEDERMIGSEQGRELA